jgi:prepilin-type N-terminal cleavage/methylation domain-containing protein
MDVKKNRARARGFTLVEMAIVLVIIGIILAGVMKGRDIVRGAQVKQFSQGFAQKWVTIASTYVDKTGQHLYDGQDNGGLDATGADGLMDDSGPMFTDQQGDSGTAGSTAEALQAARDVGITPCTLIKSDLANDGSDVNCNNNYNIWSRTVEGEWAGRQTVEVGFWSENTGNGMRNMVLMYNVPADVAIGIDTLIDGQADGENGSCVNWTNPANAFAIGNDPVANSIFPWPVQTDNAQTVLVGLILDY